MTKILLIVSSPRGEASLSTRFATELATKLKTSREGAELIVRDLVATPLPHIDVSYIDGRMKAPGDRNATEAQSVKLAEELIAELSGADIVVLGSGMINFSVSSLFKAWIDHIIWPGVTVKYTDTGAEGTLTGKKVYVVAASGGIYSAGAMTAFDFQVGYVKHLLSFVGMTDIDVIQIEGMAFGPDAAQAAIDKASTSVTQRIEEAA